MDTQSAIQQFILENLLQGQRRNAFKLDEPLVSSGVVDSLGILRLIGFLEQEFALTVGDGDVNPENFETMRQILQFIERKQLERPDDGAA